MNKRRLDKQVGFIRFPPGVCDALVNAVLISCYLILTCVLLSGQPQVYTKTGRPDFFYPGGVARLIASIVPEVKNKRILPFTTKVTASHLFWQRFS